MRIVFMGTPDFAIPSLRALADSSHYNVRAVFTQPDKPRGRGNKMMPTPAKKLSHLLGIPVYQPEKLSDSEVINTLQDLNPVLIVVVAYGKILPAKVLNIPSKGCVNVHASLLPKYRGAAPIHRAIINGEDYTGVTTMQMDTGMDTGNILLKKTVPINEEDTAGILHDRLAEEGARLLLDTLYGIEKGEILGTPQNEDEATYAPPLKREDEIIDWEKTAREVKDLVRGLNPWPGARTFWGDKILKIWEVQIEKQVNTSNTAGTVLENKNQDGIIVQTGEGAVKITQLQLQGKSKMNASEFLKGHSVPEGTILGSY